MSVNLPNHYIEKYQNNLRLSLQRYGSVFRPCCEVNSYEGNGARAIDFFDPIEMDQVTTRFAPMPRTDAGLDAVWVYPEDYRVAQMVDSFDKLRVMTDPKSKLVESATRSAGRKIDDVVRTAFFGTMQTGVRGQSTEQFSTANHRVAVTVGNGGSGNVNMNAEKIKAGLEIMLNANVDVQREEIYLAVSPSGWRALLDDDEFINEDFKTGTINGVTMMRFLNTVNIMVYNDLENTADPYRRSVMWCKSGMHLGFWRDITSRVDERPDIDGVPYQLYTTLTLGATRTEAGKVVDILCNEA
ncbi:MAG: phage capsid protein [Pseudomonadota bacterium]